MSIKLMNAVWDLVYPDSQKIVMLALADQANDSGQCWPSVATIARRCSKAERTVQHVLRDLEEAGDLTRYDRAGTSSMYRVHPRKDRTPAATAPPQPLHPTPAAVAPLPPQPLHPTPPLDCTLTTNEPPLEPPLNRGRASRLSADFSPILTESSQSIVSKWPPGMLERELEQFKDRATAKGETYKDWQAAFRTWIRNADKWRTQNGQRNTSRTGHGTTVDAVDAWLRHG